MSWSGRMSNEEKYCLRMLCLLRMSVNSIIYNRIFDCRRRISMNDIDVIINQLKGLYKRNERIVFDYPPYVEFHENLTNFIYRNNLDESKEWEIIKKNLVVKSSQYMITKEADIILVELENLKRILLKGKYEKFWEYVHPRIRKIAENKFFHGYYADSVESAFKEINSRVKNIYLKK